MAKKRSRKLLIASLIITLTILLIIGFIFIIKSNKENKNQNTERSSLANIKNCPNCKKEISISDKFCSFCGVNQQTNQDKTETTYQRQQAEQVFTISWIKIQKTTSGKYFVNWLFHESKNIHHSYCEESKNVFSVEKMPEILALHKDCWQNNDWSGWEKELKDNYLLVKEKVKGENGFQYQTYYEFHPTSQADREEEVQQQIIKQAERIREECKERAKEAQERARKWKEEHKNEWKNCSKCGKHLCLENEGSISNSEVRKDGGEPVYKTEYFCGNCTRE